MLTTKRFQVTWTILIGKLCCQVLTLRIFLTFFYQTVLKACKNHTAIKPPKKVNHNSAHERSYRSLLRKKRKLKCRLDCIQSINPNSPKIRKIKHNLEIIMESMKELTFTKQAKDEMRAINKIKTNPKFFFSYAKKRSKTNKT